MTGTEQSIVWLLFSFLSFIFSLLTLWLISTRRDTKNNKQDIKNIVSAIEDLNNKIKELNDIHNLIKEELKKKKTSKKEITE